MAEGPPCRLISEQEAQLPALLGQGAEVHGFRGLMWTTERVAALIEKQFGVKYHPAHMSRLLKRIDHSLQKPVEKASQRKEEVIIVWKEQHWPEVKKAQQEERTIAFVDEAGFTCSPYVCEPMLLLGERPCCGCR